MCYLGNNKEKHLLKKKVLSNVSHTKETLKNLKNNGCVIKEPLERDL